VSFYRNGHYRSAALDAYIRVIDEVKSLSGLALDGDKLMNAAFGSSGVNIPIIQFNDLKTEADRDEQTGILYLFKGIVGLRNMKAHSNQMFKDAERGYGYLALSSLLMRLLETAQINPRKTNP
jgi:uncharacterized protein (TIGR02391 family)